MLSKKAILIILDGFGEGEKNEITNAIYKAKTPFIDNIKTKYSHSLLEPGGETVGVLPGQTGGSDVGHNTIGAGRIIRQPIKIIYDAIQDGSFFNNEYLLKAIHHAKKYNSNLHLMGIGADSFIHSYTPYIYALLDLCLKEKIDTNKVYLHLATDGRDNPPDSAIKFLTEIEKKCQQKNIGKIASIIGRFYLDRGQNWDRTEILYSLLTNKSQSYKLNWLEYINHNYKQKITDEFLSAQAFGNEQGIYPRVSNNDAVINFCYRADRQRQITQALTELDFDKFNRPYLDNLYYVGFINYADNLVKAHYAFKEEQANICLSEVINQASLKQLHLAGREKIIFVTYNLNRCQELKLITETDIKAPQTKEVETFDLNPEMSAPKLTEILKNELVKNEQDIYIINYENCDQVGHTGNFLATVKAVEAVDKSLAEIIPLALEKGFTILITADHGNADLMVDTNGQPYTAHSHNKVPCILISNNLNIKLKNGTLADIAPTFLDILGLEKPQEMTGQSLIEKK